MRSHSSMVANTSDIVRLTSGFTGHERKNYPLHTRPNECSVCTPLLSAVRRGSQLYCLLMPTSQSNVFGSEMFGIIAFCCSRSIVCFHWPNSIERNFKFSHLRKWLCEPVFGMYQVSVCFTQEITWVAKKRVSQFPKFFQIAICKKDDGSS